MLCRKSTEVSDPADQVSAPPQTPAAVHHDRPGAAEPAAAQTPPGHGERDMTQAELKHWAELYAHDNSTAVQAGSGHAHVIFRLGGERFAVPLADLDEVARVEVGIGLSRAGALVLGLVNIRGEVVPLLDTAGALGARGSYRLGNKNRTLVVRDARDRRTALPVDQIESIELLPPDLFRVHRNDDDKALIRRIGIGEHAGGSLTLLDMHGLRGAGANGRGDDTF